MSEPEGVKRKRREAKNVVEGDAIGAVVGDKGKVKVNKIEVVKGNKIRIVYGDNSETEIDADDPFFAIYRQIEAKPKDRKKLVAEVDQIRREAKKDEQDIRQNFLQERLGNLAKMAPDIFEVTVATLANPALGFAVIAQKIAKKAREEYGQQKADV